MARKGELPPRKTRRDFQLLAEMRATETNVLAHNGCEQGAYCTGGLAIECALKACIAKKTKRHEFPPDRESVQKLYSHNLTELLKFAGLDKLLERDSKKSQTLAENWGVVQSWKVDSRYHTSGLRGADMNTAVTSSEGVLQWIKRRW